MKEVISVARKVCERCEKGFEAKAKNARYCFDCRKIVLGDYARERKLNMLGAEARWGKHGE